MAAIAFAAATTTIKGRYAVWCILDECMKKLKLELLAGAEMKKSLSLGITMQIDTETTRQRTNNSIDHNKQTPFTP
jgi:hypothetical protein